MRKMRIWIGVAVIAVAAGGAIAVTTTANASAPGGGCPRGYDLMSVESLAAQGYHLPALVDDSTTPGVGFGHEPGNGDGFVCAQPLGNRLTPSGHQLYDFRDNTLPSSD
jgi:hypothetical protein